MVAVYLFSYGFWNENMAWEQYKETKMKQHGMHANIWTSEAPTSNKIDKRKVNVFI